MQVTQVAQNLTAIIVCVSISKIILAMFFAAGERRAGMSFVWLFYPLRLMFYYNPFSMYNLPRKMAEDPDQPVDEFQKFTNSAKLRMCYQEIELTLMMVAGLLLVMSSQNYRQSKWLKSFYKNNNRCWRRNLKWLRSLI